MHTGATYIRALQLCYGIRPYNPSRSKSQPPNLYNIIQVPKPGRQLTVNLVKRTLAPIRPSLSGPLPSAGQTPARLTLKITTPKARPAGVTPSRRAPLVTGGLKYAIKFGPGSASLTTNASVSVGERSKLEPGSGNLEALVVPGTYQLTIITEGGMALSECAGPPT